MMSDLLAALRDRGWVIDERTDASDFLPDDVKARYPSLPDGVVRFLGRLDVAHNEADDVWMLTAREFRRTDTDGFRWNEYERMGLEGEADDPERRSAITAFWNDHFPFIMAVHSDYDYLAVRLTEPYRGSVVHGFAPDWEETTEIARSFEEFVRRFTAAAASREPEYPFDVFL